MTTPYEITQNEFHKPRFVAIIPRWSVVPVTRRQTNGEHIFLVARYAIIIADALNSSVDRYQLVHLALTHDDAEAVTGDLPSGSPLAMFKEIPPAQDEPYLIMKTADRLEAYQYAMEEIRLGNKYMLEHRNELWEQFIAALLLCTGNHKAVIDMVSK